MAKAMHARAAVAFVSAAYFGSPRETKCQTQPSKSNDAGAGIGIAPKANDGVSKSVQGNAKITAFIHASGDRRDGGVIVFAAARAAKNTPITRESHMMMPTVMRSFA